MILVTGGCGFIGSAFILDWLHQGREPVVNLDLLTYAGHLGNLREVDSQPAYRFVRGDIGDADLVARLLGQHRPRAIVHFAAESHVDRSIAGPEAFIQTNVVGTTRLLQAACEFWKALPESEAEAFRFINVSTDEVFGSLQPGEPAFSERHQYQPNSPYSASKAAADHFARAWHHTFKLPVITTNCSNNYGPRQFPEKLIPLMIHNALAGKPLPVYGDGRQVRDWLHVSDHCSALRAVLEHGKPGETYNIGGRSERTNLEVVHTVCKVLDEARPGCRHADLIQHVPDRRGHDRRYGIDDTKIAGELGWKPSTGFEQGIRDTVHWYLTNPEWVESVTSGAYRRWVEQQYPTIQAA
ncbi:dTDP-glucose 4,6-dehydratase [Ramlibacter henchirensis]|uniref:dTDP-glucose 4,6-dehydratase n=1 Tax=Ramlibacter henchirensis TaxID=204072 RepID=A0A4Z0C1T8_9BURK|nr:dTDP-glucose 4,6-dehydratase [Ramlibacter henchirensis]TFZ05201.1 dTDP-glucose 4,6-dehydratase [Ramlibacter henchirensis]